MIKLQRSTHSWFSIFILVSLLGTLFQAGCGTSSISPFESLKDLPFSSAPDGYAPVIKGNLPAGFTFDEPEFVVEPVGGGDGYVTTINYHKDGLDIQVGLIGFTDEAIRSDFLDVLSEQVDSKFVQISGFQVVRYYNADMEGRMWISGPYIVGISCQSSASSAGQSLDALAEKYILVYPPRQ